MKKCGMRDSLEKGAGMRDQDPPFQTLLYCYTLSQNYLFCFALKNFFVQLIHSFSGTSQHNRQIRQVKFQSFGET